MGGIRWAQLQGRGSHSHKNPTRKFTDRMNLGLSYFSLDLHEQPFHHLKTPWKHNRATCSGKEGSVWEVPPEWIMSSPMAVRFNIAERSRERATECPRAHKRERGARAARTAYGNSRNTLSIIRISRKMRVYSTGSEEPRGLGR